MFLYKPALCLYPLVFCSCRKLNTFSTDSLHWLAVKPEVAEIGAVALVWRLAFKFWLIRWVHWLNTKLDNRQVGNYYSYCSSNFNVLGLTWYIRLLESTLSILQDVYPVWPMCLCIIMHKWHWASSDSSKHWSPVIHQYMHTDMNHTLRLGFR